MDTLITYINNYYIHMHEGQSQDTRISFKFQHKNNKIDMLELNPIFRGKYSSCVHILFLFIASTRDDHCWKLEGIFHKSVKGVEQLEVPSV